ncbi:MAG: hypothetical protein ACRD4Y_02020 [Candidatus Acidiferrales bacterium]
MRHFNIVQFLGILCALALVGCSGSPSSSNPSAASGGNGDAPAAGNPAATQSSGGQSSGESSLSHLFSHKSISVDAGTEIVVTADQSVSSKTSNSGDHFDVSVAEPVVVGNKVVIPKGSTGTGTVTDAKSAGKFKGNAEISVTLSSLNINGEDYEVRTSEVTEASKGRGKRTAVGAGGGAVVGALIGALAGGGKGAAIGAGAGAGAGTAGAAFTGKRDITIPAERRLTFRLDDPLEVKQQ